MRQIFRPAIRLMNQLNYPQKFLLISLLFVLPLIVVLTLLLGTLNEDIRSARKELDGIQYLRPLRTVLQATIEQQFLAERYLNGEPDAEPVLIMKNAELKASLGALSEVDAVLGKNLQTSVQYASLQNQAERLHAQLLLRLVADSNAAHARFISTIRTLMQRVGDTAGLVLDANIDASYLTDVVLLEVPENQDLLAQTVGLLGIVTNDQQGASDDKTRLTIIYALFQSNLTRLESKLKTMFTQTADQTLQPALRTRLQDVSLAENLLLTSINQRLFGSERLQTSVVDFRKQQAAALAASFNLWDRTSDTLEGLLNARIAGLARQRAIVLTLSGLMAFIVAYLLAGFYLAVMGTVGAFQAVTQQMIGGNFSQQVAINTRDELGRVATSFNAIAAALVESSTQRQAIVEHAAHAILTFNEQGNIESLNPAATRMFGSAELLGQPITTLLLSDLATLQAVASMREISGQRHDGSTFIAEVAVGQAQRNQTPLWIVFVRDITVRKQAEAERNRLQDEMIRAQATVLAELSMPLIPISATVMVLPLIGAMDSERIGQLLNTLLHGIEQQHARVAIVDVTGVPIMDTQVAHGIIRAAQGVLLLGAELIITGIRPDVAQTLVELGVDLSAITTRSTLQSGIAYALTKRM